MLRIFVVSSHFSAILQSIYASSTKKEGYYDVLMIDYPPQKKTLSQLIFSTNYIHQWDLQLNYAPELTDSTNMKPGFKKRVLRKIKQLPGLKTIYDVLRDRHLIKFHAAYEKRVKNDLNHVHHNQVELNLLSKTGMNEVLFKLFPEATINYFEHGIGDYMYYAQNKIRRGNFYCLFANEFSNYLASINNSNSSIIHGYLKDSMFYNAIKALENAKVVSNDKDISGLNNEQFVFILVESVEIYHVPQHFWTDCIEHYLSKVDDKTKYTYIIKPHPSQSFDAINLTEEYFKKNNLKYVMLGNSKFINIGAELIFYFFQPNTRYVFSLFSSSVYYFTKLYPSQHIKYYQGYKFFEKYTKNSPKQFTDIYKGLKPLVENVFSKACIDL